MENPSAAIDCRASLKIPFPPGYFDGLPKVQVADIFGVTEHTIDKWVRNGMPKQREGTGVVIRSCFNLIECCQWLSGKRKSDMADEPNQLRDEEMMFRREKRKMQELRRQQMEGTLVNANVYALRMAEVVETVRKGIDSLQRSFGEEVIDSFNSILDEVEEAILSKTPGSDDASAEEVYDQPVE